MSLVQLTMQEQGMPVDSRPVIRHCMSRCAHDHAASVAPSYQKASCQSELGRFQEPSKMQRLNVKRSALTGLQIEVGQVAAMIYTLCSLCCACFQGGHPLARPDSQA